MYEIQNGQVTVPGGCDIASVPAVGQIQVYPSCPQNGIASGSYIAPATSLKPALVQPTAKARFTNSTSITQFVRLGTLTEMCQAAVLADAAILPGAVVQDMSANAIAANKAWNILECVLDANQTVVTSFFVTVAGVGADSIDVLTAYPWSFDVCNPCITSSVDGTCVQPCNNGNVAKFWFTNAFLGGPTGVLVEIPALTTITIESCECAQQVNAVAGCPSPIAAIAPIQALPLCPPTPGAVAGAAGRYPYSGRGY